MLILMINEFYLLRVFLLKTTSEVIRWLKDKLNKCAYYWKKLIVLKIISIYPKVRILEIIWAKKYHKKNIYNEMEGENTAQKSLGVWLK